MTPSPQSLALEQRLNRVLAQTLNWEPLVGSMGVKERALDAFDSVAKQPPCPALARALLAWTDACGAKPLASLGGLDDRDIDPAVAQAFARACFVHLAPAQLRQARREVELENIGPGSFELAQAFVAKCLALNETPPLDELWGEYLIDSVHHYNRAEARAMARLLSSLGPEPEDFLDRFSREGSSQVLLGCLEGMPHLLSRPELPLIIDRYADDDQFDCPAPGPALRAFDEAVAMGMDPCSRDASLFSTPQLAAKVEAALLDRASAPAPARQRAGL